MTNTWRLSHLLPLHTARWPSSPESTLTIRWQNKTLGPLCHQRASIIIKLFDGYCVVVAAGPSLPSSRLTRLNSNSSGSELHRDLEGTIKSIHHRNTRSTNAACRSQLCRPGALKEKKKFNARRDILVQESASHFDITLQDTEKVFFRYGLMIISINNFFNSFS